MTRHSGAVALQLVKSQDGSSVRSHPNECGIGCDTQASPCGGGPPPRRRRRRACPRPRAGPGPQACQRGGEPAR
eukprot:3364745-Prymnesium_polylepis.1